MTGKRELAKSTAVVSAGIAVSRVLGFIRDVLLARFFGIGISAQAFVMAFTLPNSLRHLVAEGAVNTALVPLLTEYKTKKSKAEFWHFTNVLFNLFAVVLLFIAIAGVLAAPLLVRIIAPGFIRNPDKLALTIALMRMVFPYVFLVGLTAYCIGVLHTFKHFTAPAFSSAVLNLTLLAGILAFYPFVNIAYLGYAVLIGGILQIAFQLPPLLKKGPFFNFKAGFINEGAKRFWKLLLPRMAGAGIYQINIIVDRMLASLAFIGEGAVAALYYGNRLFQLPLALFSVAMVTTALPAMSSHVIEKNIDKLKETVAFSLKNMLFFSMPASAGLIVLSRPIIKVLFERNEFTPHATDITSAVLLFYAIGLTAYGGVKILVAVFHSMQDTRTPVKTAFLALISNVILNLILMAPLKAGGLALATSISGFIHFGFLFRLLRKKIGPFGERELLNFFLKILSASLIMALFAYALMRGVRWDGGIKDILSLILIICFSMMLYLCVSLILKVKRARALFSWIKRP